MKLGNHTIFIKIVL